MNIKKIIIGGMLVASIIGCTESPIAPDNRENGTILSNENTNYTIIEGILGECYNDTVFIKPNIYRSAMFSVYFDNSNIWANRNESISSNFTEGYIIINLCNQGGKYRITLFK